MSVNSKKNKSHVISTRYTEDEYMDIMLKISDIEGSLMMTVSEFSRAATLGANVSIVDSELERYRVFIMSRISNNINQIARSINIDRKEGIVSEKTYIDSLKELKTITTEMNRLLDPLR